MSFLLSAAFGHRGGAGVLMSVLNTQIVRGGLGVGLGVRGWGVRYATYISSYSMLEVCLTFGCPGCAWC